MALQKQTLPVSFGQGIDTKTDPNQVVLGKMLTLENAVLTESKAYQTRNGFTALTTNYVDVLNNTGTISSAINVLEFGSELVLLDSLNVFSYSSQENIWHKRGLAPATLLTSTNISESSAFSDAGDTPPASPNIAINNNNVALYTWSVENIFRFALKDLNTDTFLFGSNKAASIGENTSMMNIPFGKDGKFIVFSYYTSKIAYFLIDPAVVNTDPTETDIITGLPSNTGYFDAVKSPDNNTVYLFYTSSANVPKLAKIDISTGVPIVSSTVTLTGQTGLNNVAVGYDTTNNYIWVGYNDATTNTKVAVFNTSLAAILAPTLVDAVSTGLHGIGFTFKAGVAYLFYDVDYGAPPFTPVSGSALNASIKVIKVTNAGVITPMTYIPTVFMLSKPFLVTSGVETNVPYIIGGFTGYRDEQPNYFLFRLDEIYGGFTVAGRFASGSAPTSVVYNSGHFPASEILKIDSDHYLFNYLFATNTFSIAGVILADYTVYGLNLAFNQKRQKVVLGNNSFVTGGIVSAYDSQIVSEANFLVFPEGMTAGENNVIHGGLSTGEYQYVVLYEWTDAFGQVNRSSPSIPFSAAMTAGDSMDLTIPVLRVTNKGRYSLSTFQNGGSVTVALYRTVANGSIFFRLKSYIQPDFLPGGYNILDNDKTADADIIGSSELYTTGGELENSAPFAADAITTFKNRVITVTSENPYTWNYSKQVIVNTPVEFSDQFNSSIDQKGGPISAVSAMDDKLVFFKDTLIFYIVGDGPAPNGTQNDFSYPQIISTDVGCPYPDSVVLTPVGIMFKSLKGIYLLERSLQTVYIGADVEAYNSQTITSAINVENTTQVRFTLNNGTELVYDYFYQQWSVFTNVSAVDATNWNGAYAYAQANGAVQKETTGVYNDNTAAIIMKLKSGWFSFAQLQGYQRVWRFLVLAKFLSNHNLTFEIAYDFDPTITQTFTIPVGSSITPEQFRCALTRQRCESLQITLTMTPTAAVGAGATLSSFGFEVGVKKGLNKMPAAKTYG